MWCLLVFVILSEDVVFSAWRRFAVDSKQQNESENFHCSLMLSTFLCLLLSPREEFLALYDLQCLLKMVKVTLAMQVVEEFTWALGRDGTRGGRESD